MDLTDIQRELQAHAREFARKEASPRAADIDRSEAYPWDTVGAFDLALDYVKQREQFGRPICEFQGLQWMLVDMSIALQAARALVHQAAAGAGSGFPDVVQAAQAKILASETAIRVTNDALQLFGAAGYSRNLPLERMVRDARMFTIGGGTAQILRNLVASRLLERKLPQTRDGYLDPPRS